MYITADAVFFQIGHKALPLIRLHDKQMIDMGTALRSDRQLDPGIADLRQIPLGDGAPLGCQLVQMAETHPQKPGLQLVQPGIKALIIILIPLHAAIVPQRPKLIPQGRVVRQNRAGIAERSQIFVG